MKCPFCDRSNLNTSRIRSSDYPSLLVGRLPMRCRDCAYRFFAWLPQVLIFRLMEKSEILIDGESPKAPQA
jgi:hypothetical protein